MQGQPLAKGESKTLEIIVEYCNSKTQSIARLLQNDKYHVLPQWFREPRLKVLHCTQYHFPCSVSNGSSAIGPSQAEQLLRVTSAIAAELIKAHDANQTVSLNELRAKMSKKYGFGGVPRLVDIISAIPDDYKKALLPRLKARPIRTASGVSVTIRP